ncbi:MAG: GIY-YIG nuclease family protein [Candidatus Omnitrophota bacterium]
MYQVYILKSKKDNLLYVGYTNNIERRLKEHNDGKVKYTESRKSWNLIYFESFTSLEDARQREISLKHFGKAFGQLRRRIKNSLNR